MYEKLPRIEDVSKTMLYSIAEKAFVKANLPLEQWGEWREDAAQVVWLSLFESQEKPDGVRISRAKWAAFEFVIDHVYGQLTDWLEISERDFAEPQNKDDEFPVEWAAIVHAFSEYLPPSYLAIAIWLLQGKSNFEIAEMGNYSSEDSARAMVSKCRQRIRRHLNL